MEADEKIKTSGPLEIINIDDIEYTIIGTAHVSKASAEDVKLLTNENKYDAIAVELCENRYQNLTNPEQWKQLDLFQVIKTGKLPFIAASLVLGAYQQRIAKQFGIEPGAEMKMAIQQSKKHDIPIYCIDRDIGITLKRAAKAIPWWQKLSLPGGLLISMLRKDEIAEDEVEKLKSGDLLESTFKEFAAESKGLYNSLVKERDHFMAAKLNYLFPQNQLKKVLVVIGAGHLKGLKTVLTDNNQENPQQIIQELETKPPRNKIIKWLPWVIVAAIVTGFIWGFIKSPELGWELIRNWVIINGSLSALGCLIAMAHPLTTITAFVAAPITSLNPTVGAGMVTALVETWLKKPTVNDFDQLKDDITHLSGWWKNRVAKILLIFTLSSFGSAIGTYVAGFNIFEKLAS